MLLGAGIDKSGSVPTEQRLNALGAVIRLGARGPDVGVNLRVAD